MILIPSFIKTVEATVPFCQVVARKIWSKIRMENPLNKFDGVFSKLTAMEEFYSEDKENTTKQEKNENEDFKKSVNDGKEEIKLSENDNTAVESNPKEKFENGEVKKSANTEKVEMEVSENNNTVVKGKEKIENGEAKKSASKDKVEVEASENNNTVVKRNDKGKWNNLRFMQSKIIKNKIGKQIKKKYKKLRTD